MTITRPAPPSADCFRVFPRLSTERFALREITPDDAEALFEMYSNPEVMEYWSTLPYESIEQARELIGRIQSNLARGEGVEWAITPLDDERRLLGKCGFHRWMKPHYRAEMGYSLQREGWGQGIMGEVLRAIIAYGWREMGLHSIEAQLEPGNARSVRTLERLGFVKEGHFRENFYLGGRFTDTAVYSLLEPR